MKANHDITIFLQYSKDNHLNWKKKTQTAFPQSCSFKNCIHVPGMQTQTFEFSNKGDNALFKDLHFYNDVYIHLIEKTRGLTNLINTCTCIYIVFIKNFFI